MRSTLFHVPLEVDGVPLFGWGLLACVWAIVACWVIARAARREGLVTALAGLGLPLAVAGAVIVWGLPAIADDAGLPIRGYGVMLLVAAAAGTWLSVRRGARLGFDADTIIGLGMEIFLWGIVGARLFYVVQYRAAFFDAGIVAAIPRILNVAQGGLVVFGSLPTAALAAWLFARRRGLPILRLADCIAPGLLLGLAIGRVGCFLNGCCYGGPCDLPWAVSFPPDSPPWLDQQARGLLPAIAAGGPRPWSLPVHPAQLYAAIDAALLAALAVAATPWLRRDGEVFALVLTLHPVSRMLLEAIRVDEPPLSAFLPLSISQAIAVVLLALAAALWWWIGRQSGNAEGHDRRDRPRGF
ncbi:MAG: prolipoprotein diacylglyceryl transferase [Planctomycetia bacterium]|jgi:phosphatidylglycerol:prolipoprotein diacylglycerol transferase